ncbi:hypothetical protein GUJ93_ZPchr0009g1506 [Zizania palustris]|uniref:Protein TILLER ANGLE CONTROL 1 n=1 Tax=Zizania palustris TaxID=103762 RepID=A0A8J5RW35_ZIZPA|nr:hypothetical protein GUJ93_ZPchr0009g1506 [Zizania palustris]
MFKRWCVLGLEAIACSSFPASDFILSGERSSSARRYREKLDELLQRKENRALRFEDQSFGDVSSGDIDEDSERLESVKTAAVSTVSVSFISCALFGVTFCAKPDGTGRHIIAPQIWVLLEGCYSTHGTVKEPRTSFGLNNCTRSAIGTSLDTLYVFNWLNRKKHCNIEYCTINENRAMEEKEDSVRASMNEQDTEALLLRDVLINGILAIGTLGHNVNSLCPESYVEQDESMIVGDEEVEVEKCEEEKSEAKEDMPMPVTARSEPAKMHSSSTKEDIFTCLVKEDVLMRSMQQVEDVAKIQEQPLLMLERVEKVRTTLADLFAAETFSSNDTAEKFRQNIIVVAGATTSEPPTSCTEKMHHKKPTKPASKQLKATTRKLSRVMRKMLGKKIHPEQLNGRSNAEGLVTA